MELRDFPPCPRKLSVDDDEDAEDDDVDRELPLINPPVLVTVVPLPTSRSEVKTGWGTFEEEERADDEEGEKESDVEESSLEVFAGFSLLGSPEPPKCMLVESGGCPLPFVPTP